MVSCKLSKTYSQSRPAPHRYHHAVIWLLLNRVFGTGGLRRYSIQYETGPASSFQRTLKFVCVHVWTGSGIWLVPMHVNVWVCEYIGLHMREVRGQPPVWSLRSYSPNLRCCQPRTHKVGKTVWALNPRDLCLLITEITNVCHHAQHFVIWALEINLRSAFETSTLMAKLPS